MGSELSNPLISADSMPSLYKVLTMKGAHLAHYIKI